MFATVSGRHPHTSCFIVASAFFSALVSSARRLMTSVIGATNQQSGFNFTGEANKFMATEMFIGSNDGRVWTLGAND